MVRAETLPVEGPRYTAALVFVPGLWAGPDVWRSFASFLAHRGWEPHLLDTRALPGGIAGRATVIAEYAASLAAPPVIVGHDAGAVAALVASRGAAVAAVVLAAPLVPGSRGARALTLEPRNLFRLLAGRPVPPPHGPAAALAWATLDDAVRGRILRGLAPEDAAIVWEIARGGVSMERLAGVPALVVAGTRDPLLSPEGAAALAERLGADARVLPDAGHWLLAEPRWQEVVGVVHRWLVQRLGEPLLETYAEAMADRETDGDEDG
jgi:pimeloyl-ACP methyl ester carboxylesterase